MNTKEQDKKIIKLHMEGKSDKDISEITQSSKSKIYNVIKANKSGTVINYKKHGRKKGEKRRIPESFYDYIITHKPDNGVWTVNTIKEKLYSYDIVVSVNTIKNFLKRHELYKTFPKISKKVLTTKKPKEILYVYSEYLNRSNIGERILFYAYDSHKCYYFLTYKGSNEVRNDFGEEVVNNGTALLFDFIIRCLKVKVFGSVVVYATVKCIIQTLKKEDWVILNKNYKKSINMPKIVKSEKS